MSRKLKLKTSAKIRLAKMSKHEFASISTDKGELFLVDAEEPAVGVEVYITNEDGENFMPDNGDYVHNGNVISVEDGVITNVEKSEEKQEEMSSDEDITLLAEVLKQVVERQDDLEARVSALEGKEGVSVEDFNSVKEKLSAIEKKSNGKFFKQNPGGSGEKQKSVKELLEPFKKK